jgi:hypothetical protein
MRRNGLAFLGLCAVLLPSCTSITSKPTDGESVVVTNSEGTATTSTLLISREQPISPSGFVPKERCQINTLPFELRLETNSPRPAAVGFPRAENRFPTTRPKILVLPFEFTDAPISEGLIAATKGGLNSANNYFESISWGKAGIEFEIAPESSWIRIPQTAESLNFAKDSQKNRNSWYWFRDVLQFSSPDLNLEGFDIVYLVGSPSLIEWFTAIMDLTDPPIESPGGRVNRAVLITRDHSKSGIIAHELAHAWLSLEDLYNLIPGSKDFVGLNRFDLMGGADLTQYSSNDMTIWNKNLAGWVSEEMFRCVDAAGTYEVFISANSDDNAFPKAVGVRLSATKILMIETWRTSTYNICCDETIAYVVDASRAAGSGPYRLQGAMDTPGQQLDLSDPNFITTSNLNLQPNEQLNLSKVSISLLESDRSGALVRVVVS